MTILDKTTDLIVLYDHLCGESEVPKEYHFWSFLSLLASRVEDRVWLEKLKGEKLTPLLYVFLLGPPALGKGTAIGKAVRLGVEASKQDGRIRVYNGQTTAAHFIDVLGGGLDSNREGAQCLIANPKLWLVTDELANDIGKGVVADAFVKLMTKLYTGTGVPVETGTRTHGSVKITDPNVNWLAGTTDEWLISCLTQESIYSGFTSRVTFVSAGYHDTRYRRPHYPKDYEEVKQYIIARLVNLHHVSGQFAMTDDAEKREDTWYMNRSKPVERILFPSWQREQNLVLKLAMLLSLAEGTTLVIQEYHIIEAIKLSTSVQKHVASVIEQASKNPQTAAIGEVETALMRFKKIEHTPLSRLMRRRGIPPDQLRKIIDSLTQEGQVKWGTTTTGARVYEWVEGK